MGVRFCMTNGNCQECAKLTFLLASTLSVFFNAQPLLAQNAPVAPRASASATGAKSRVDQARELNRQGIELQSTGKLKEACDCYRRAILLNSQGAGYHNNLALALKDLGELTEAEAEARVALKLRPQRADYQFNLGIILQRQKRFEESEAAFKEALSMDPSDTDCHYRLSTTLFRA
jgi:tetratricopeptide (TPR) repeat protein